MKLKYVELYGFKSFADKTKLEFNKDISAVVGPNGSGKSNIADAIKWVLGEQSAKSLRGSNMQDVIFSGSESKKQMNMAQVSIVLDNSDKSLPIAFNEVNVTRRVFRTGDSEYLINKSPVRLKEIKELLLDTGIGKDGYSMIGQGRIDEILSGKNEDRREIFEEATGVSKNKYKKNESEKKLIKNEENLNQLKNELKIKQQEYDILEVQSSNAKEGIKLTSRLEVLELSSLSKSIEKVSGDLVNDKSKLELINNDLISNSKRLSKLSSKIEPITSDIQNKEIELEKLKEESIKGQNSFVNTENEINLLNEKNKFYSSDIDRLNKSLDINTKKLENLRKLKDEKEKQKEVLIQDKAKISKILEDNKLKSQEIIKQIEDNNKKIKLLSEEILREKDSLSNLQVNKNTKERLDDSNIKLKDNYLIEIDKLNDLIIDKSNRIEKLYNDLTLIEEQLKENANKITEIIEYREKKLSIIKELEEKIVNLNNEYLREESKKDILERQYKSYDGFYKSVQNLLTISDKDKNISDKIVGVLADLIEIDDKYKVALDLALGSSLQNIVINNEVDGKYLINFIKQKNIGRITFLPINKINGAKNNIKHPKVIDTLNNLVRNDKNIEGIIDHFLSKTILVETIDDAVIVSNYIKGYRVITLDGEIINSWGSMVGGATFKKDSNSLLNRKKELDDINSSLLSTKNNILDNRKIYENNKKELDDIIYNLQAIDNKNNELISNKTQINSSINEINIEKTFNEKRLKEFSDLVENIDKELLSVDFSNINVLESNIEKHQKEYDSIFYENELIKSNQSEIEKSIVKNQSELDVIIRDQSIISNDIENYIIDIDEISKNIETEKSLLDLTNKNNKESYEKINQLEREKVSISENTKLNKELLDSLSNEINDLKSKINNDNLEISNLKDSISENEKEKYKLEIKIENSEQKVSDLRQDYIDTYSISEEELDEKLSRIEKVDVNRKEIIDIKKRLSEIGYFNFESIEQFNLIAEELDFMKKQYEDLIISRNDIINMIKEIEKDMKEKFSSSFEKINIRFNEIFKILFNGGESELRLDSEDLLTAGIEIIARPPGKKLKNLALLSGGERALTAVALLFAIFEINPSPFCVLDEIDAALDDANIKRYVNYLKSLTEQTQFIIITHRKPTMEMAEILYGVTMEEQGISKVITLALDRYKEN